MISSRCYYALKAVLELAKREGSGPVAISEIAASQKIPARFLEAILRQLKQSGITDSARGKAGGYFLAKPAHSVRLGTVIRLFEGPLVAVGPRSKGSMAMHHASVLDNVWKQAESALAGVYDSIDFTTLAEQDRILENAGTANYSI
jgi:Rrf2 family transcriptional regulator, cysteine metabolism repressor